jgi:hypothetical protein
MHNVFYRYFDTYHYFQTVSTMTATARTATSFIYYVMCLEAKYYNYLASSDVKIK